MAKKRNKTKKKQTFKLEYISIALLFVCLFAVFSFGFIGVFFANIIRLFVGDTYRFVSILLIIYAIYMLFKRTPSIPMTKKQMIASCVFTIIILVFFEYLGFANRTNLMSDTWKAISTDLFSNQLKQATGGGMIGAVLANIFTFLFGEIGTYLILLLLLGITLVLVSGKTISDFIDMAQHTRTKVQKTQIKLPKSVKEVKEDIDSVLYIEEDDKPAVENIEPIVINSFQPEPDVIDPVVEEVVEKEVTFSVSKEDSHYELPPVTLLNRVEPVDQSSEHELIKRNIRILEDTFKSFGVNARVISANLGPSVTKFEVQPAVGVKVSKIVSLTDDLALALAAKDIRIEAPIPGKSFVGIEVPNQTTSMVSFREIIEGNIDSKSKLEVPLGRDISGNIRMADLSKMPHLLVAGATGSGKSVAINGMITSILMKAKPSEVKLMMIDPKKVELNVYNGIPHLLTPVVTNPRRAAQALQKVVLEMERRYELFAQTGMRNIIGYNEQVDEFNETADEPMEKMPYIVVIVDELADLMMVASNEVESAIIRLAQMARAAGIHMVLATQRPSVDVITGLIKANVPSRMAFAVSSSIDSRTIIDSNGAEKLLGKGDMLFQPMGENKPIRVQGAFLSDSEVEKIVEFVKNQQEANYVEDMIPTDEPVSQGEPEDELFTEVVEFLKEQEFISVSMLQRRFRIGFNRAARLMDELEAKGHVGAAEGTKPRRVLINTEV
ncbi:DNA translocase FtsK [Carnobacteriaceae bacterium zg-84]|uniref:DNA translocase FtsK n=1 Tax=Granulicatella sp. zg-84 TaxID=2678503 RepID=UPI0013C11EB1|nr:cell division protein FtsK [Granulicatella sp. zg-84]QMI85351.1 DNA translocase FtsK [Carnobacteriaceae bacterium zg-84]